MTSAPPAPLGRAPRFAPADLLKLSPEEADRLLDRLEATVPVRPGLVDLPARLGTEAIVFGDTHGDWRSTEPIVDVFLERPGENCLVGLGDYVDRAPDDCGEGSVANALFLLGLAAEFPDRVFLLQGNHEAVRRIAALPHDLPEEVDQLWGPDQERYDRLMALLERGPLAALTESGAYLAHAGFPRAGATEWRARFDSPTDETLLDVLWTDCAPSRIDRGISTPFDALALTRFLTASGAYVFLRGHDPDVTGRPLFGGRCLTLHTTRFYQRFGGVVYARVPLRRPVRSTDDLAVVHVPSEGRSFPEP